MKQAFGAILIAIGFLSTVQSNMKAKDAPDLAFLLGSYTPGLLMMLIGLALFREKPASKAGQKVQRFRTRADYAVAIGIAMMFMGSGILTQAPDTLLLAIAVAMSGWALMVWGCVNYTHWKGYSGWFGLFGYLLLPGLIIIACFPNRRVRAMRMQPESENEPATASTVDQRLPFRYLLTLLPPAVLLLVVATILHGSRANVAASEWQEVKSVEAGFQAFMPGTPRLEQKTQETPAGNIELHKFLVEPAGKKELFMITSVRFPEDFTRDHGGIEKLLELGRMDLLTASEGKLKSERRLVLGGYPVLEVEILPPAGAIIKARIYATKNQVFQVTVHVPIIRLRSEDVQKFFDSFQLSAKK